MGIDLAERFFHVDSEAVLSLLRLLVGDGQADARWRLTLVGIDRLLSDLGFDEARGLELMRALRQSFGKEFHGGTFLDKQLGDRFRKERQSLEDLLDPTRQGESAARQQLDVLGLRSHRLAPLMGELRAAQAAGGIACSMEELAASFIHMHANRMLRAAAREHELVICDFLARIYESRLARASKANRPRVGLTG